MYTVDYFIKKFEKIPEENWAERVTGSDGRYCAVGHCGVHAAAGTSAERYQHTDESISLMNILSPLADCGYENCVINMINDGWIDNYKQNHPKKRILAALYDIKKMQEPVYKDITKDLAVLPEDKIEVDVKTIVNV